MSLLNYNDSCALKLDVKVSSTLMFVSDCVHVYVLFKFYPWFKSYFPFLQTDHLFYHTQKTKDNKI